MPVDDSPRTRNCASPHLEKLNELTEKSIALLSQGDFDQAARLLTARHEYLLAHITPEFIDQLSPPDKKQLIEHLNEMLAQDLLNQSKVVDMMSVINGKLGKIYKNKKVINSYLDVRNT